MDRLLATPRYHPTPLGWHSSAAEIARSGQLTEMIALERIGMRSRFARNQEIYAEGDEGGSWYRVVSGTVRICKLLPDGRRRIVEFCSSGDSFGFDLGAEREFSAEAVNQVVVMRYPRSATERLMDENPGLARRLREIMLKNLSVAQNRLLLLGRLTASERVTGFLLDLSEREEGKRRIDLPMSRSDIADYLGLTIETVCRVLSELKRRRIIALSSAHQIELVDWTALEVLSGTVGEN